MAKKQKIKLSIIIVNWNTKELLRNCLESIFQSTSHTVRGVIPSEIIVVDNGSSDNSVEFVKMFKTSNSNVQIKLIENNRNLGFAKANNQGIDKAEGEYIFLLNSDTIVPKNSLQILVDYLDKNPDTAGVSPQLVNTDGSFQFDYYMKFPNIWQMVFYHNYLLRKLSMALPLKYLFITKPKNYPFPVDQLPGAALMTRKKIIDQVGQLDESFVFFFEDVDWCYRINSQTNLNLAVCPDSTITHIGGASWKKWLEKSRFKFYRQYYLSLIKFVNKNYPPVAVFYQAGLTFSFLINFLTHILILQHKKALVQLELIKSIWTEEPIFQMPR